jgi:Acetoacetate decarboxylase (ADC)
MPIFGQLVSADHLPRAADVTALFTDADAFAVDGVEILAFTYEIDIERGFAVTPKALHPSIPSYCQIVLRRHPDSPVGPFTVGELRINTRAGTNYLGYCVGAFTDSEAACALFRERYGAPMQLADVVLDTRYYGVVGRIRRGAETIFDGLLERPHYISGSDVLYTPNLNLARVDGKPMLVHQEMEYVIGRAQRGQAVLRQFDAAAFGDARVVLRQPLPATVIQAKVNYTGVRYLVDPERPALAGTTTVGAAA